jgi:hypothetical protein
MFARFSLRAMESSLFSRYSVAATYTRADISALNRLRHGIAEFPIRLPRQCFFHVSSEPPSSNLPISSDYDPDCVPAAGHIDFILSSERQYATEEDNLTYSDVLAFLLSESQILIQSTEAYTRLQSRALTGIYAIISTILASIICAIRSVLVAAVAVVTLIKVFMAHRNSREPGYSFLSHLPLYPSLAGVAAQ